MRNLLSANFARLWRDKMFWLIEAGIFAWGCFAYFMLKVNMKNGYPLENGNSYFFNVMVFIGITIACFGGFFIGTEYSDGTMRNKLIAGHGRGEIYLANLVTVVCAGFFQYAAYVLSALTVGAALMGDMVWRTLYRPVESLALSLLSICGSAAIAVLVSMAVIDKAKVVFVNVLLSVLLLAAGVSALKGMMQPETTERLYIPETGEYKYDSEEYLSEDMIYMAEEVPNPKYLTGMERKVYMCITATLPTSQGLLCAVEEGQFERFSALNVVGTLLLVCAVSGGGILIFMRRNLK